MRCPQCGERETRVVDSRDLDDSATIRRRRECAACTMRFTTYERVEAARLVVVKRDGVRQEFDRDKLASGLRKALTRRPVPAGAAETAADAIEAELRALGRDRGPILARRGARDGAASSASTRSPTSASPASTRASRTSRTSSARSTRCTPSAAPTGVAGVSVLSDRDIRAALESGAVRIDPYDPEDLQPSSVDLHLDRRFRVFRNNRYPYIDVRAVQPDLTELLAIEDDEPFILHPGEFVLGQTLEWVELPDDLVARLEGKSSLGRLGLLIHSTAGYVDPGWKGNLTLELSNVANLPIALYSRDADRPDQLLRDVVAGRAAVRVAVASVPVPGPVRTDRLGVPPGLRGRSQGRGAHPVLARGHQRRRGLDRRPGRWHARRARPGRDLPL